MSERLSWAIAIPLGTILGFMFLAVICGAIESFAQYIACEGSTGAVR